MSDHVSLSVADARETLDPRFSAVSARFVSGKSFQKGIARRDGRKSIIARGVTRLGLLSLSRKSRLDLCAAYPQPQTNGIRYSGGNTILLPREARLLVARLLKQRGTRALSSAIRSSGFYFRISDLSWNSRGKSRRKSRPMFILRTMDNTRPRVFRNEQRSRAAPQTENPF